MSVCGYLDPSRSHHIALALVNLFEDKGVKELVLVGALNIKEQEGQVFHAVMNGWKTGVFSLFVTYLHPLLICFPLLLFGFNQLTIHSLFQVPETIPLNPNIPLADHFLGSLVSFLSVSSSATGNKIPTLLITTPAKRERRNGVVIGGLTRVDSVRERGVGS